MDKRILILFFAAGLLLIAGCTQSAQLANPVQNQTNTTLSPGSPFGFHTGNANNYSFLRDLGSSWSREGMYLIWDWMDASRDGSYRFTDAIAKPKPDNPNTGGKQDYDSMWLNAPADINIVVNVCPFRKGGSFKNSQESETYQDFVSKVVERYDGDQDTGCVLSAPDCYKNGDLQYPSENVIAHYSANPIRYWETCNQLFDTCESTGRNQCNGDYATSFALVQEKTYLGVKAADRSASVLMAGDSRLEEYPPVFKALNGKYVDIIDFHRFGQSNWYDPKKDFDLLKSSLQSSGFDISKLRFWITETGTYSGDLASSKSGQDIGPYQSETQQASGLVKAYVSGLAYGIEKIFWAWGIVEGFQRDCGIFDYTGIVYDGCDCVNGKYTCAAGVGYDQGRGVKKLSYYSYKKMVEILDGSDWGESAAMQEANGIHIYKFTKNGKHIWVAWDDNAESSAMISGITSSSVKITGAVPKYDSGKEVVDYASAFDTEIRSAQDGKITITLGCVPLYVEESS